MKNVFLISLIILLISCENKEKSEALPSSDKPSSAISKEQKKIELEAKKKELEERKMRGVYTTLDTSEPNILVFGKDNLLEVHTYKTNNWDQNTKATWEIKDKQLCYSLNDNNTESCSDYKFIGDTLYTDTDGVELVLIKIQ